MTFKNALPPIDDEMVVLDLLVRRWNDGATREIIRHFKDLGPYVEIGHHHDFSDSTYHRFRVTNRVVDALVEKYLVVGRPEWGYTDHKTLRASKAGEYLLWKERDRLGFDPQLCAEWWFS